MESASPCSLWSSVGCLALLHFVDQAVQLGCRRMMDDLVMQKLTKIASGEDNLYTCTSNGFYNPDLSVAFRCERGSCAARRLSHPSGHVLGGPTVRRQVRLKGHAPGFLDTTNPTVVIRSLLSMASLLPERQV